jgi:hypothetical protein
MHSDLIAKPTVTAVGVIAEASQCMALPHPFPTIKNAPVASLQWELLDLCSMAVPGVRQLS